MLRHLVPALAAIALVGPALACGPYGFLAQPQPVVVPANDEPHAVAPVIAEAPLVEIAILLDTSNSMDGLIDQARARLWSIVNDLAKTTKGGQIPDLRVALYEYGNSGLQQESGYIRQVIALSDDLDAVSAALFSLTTNGGDEYCGAVIGRAIDDLAWSAGDHYRAIFIAGNEPFSQGSVPYADSCKRAVSKGVVVNTIHCGSESDAREGGWIDGARLADGESLNIDQDRVEVAIEAPQDARIRELNQQLNDTYLGYGAAGRQRKAMQVEQDANAAAMAPSAAVARAEAKTSKAYRNSSWDLVDAVEDGEVDVAELDEEALPEAMRGMSPEERTAHVEAQRAKRAEIQRELAEQTAARAKYVAAEQAKSGEAGDATFGTAVRGLLKEQLSEKGYTPAE